MNPNAIATEIIDLVFAAMKERRMLTQDEHIHLDKLVKQVEDAL